MTQDDLLSKLAAKLPKLEKAAAPVKDYLTMKLPSAAELIPTARVLQGELRFEVLELVSATDWLGPVNPDGYIRNPNPNPFLPEGATPQNMPDATPGFPYRPAIEVSWLFGDFEDRVKLFLKLELPRDAAKVPSLVPLFKSADWLEREIFDMFGVVFEGHPNLTKILTPDFLKGHPMRKDYVHVKDKYDE